MLISNMNHGVSIKPYIVDEISLSY